MYECPEPTPVGYMLVEVVVSGWVIECCAPPPMVGESTTWRLEFVPAGGDHPAAADRVIVAGRTGAPSDGR